jgi:hypothetical protein
MSGDGFIIWRRLWCLLRHGTPERFGATVPGEKYHPFGEWVGCPDCGRLWIRYRR